MTDVTGFGLLGHLHDLARESGVAAEVDAAAVPAIDGVEALLRRRRRASRAAAAATREYADGFTTFADGRPRLARSAWSPTRRPPAGCSSPSTRRAPARARRRSSAASVAGEPGAIAVR